MEDITVITSITDKYDSLKENPGGARYVCYTDCYTGSNFWELRPAYNYFRDSKLNSRIYKMLAHKFVDSKWIIWIDGSLKLKVKPEKLLKRTVKDIAFFSHPGEVSIYKEIQTSRERNSDDKGLLQKQEELYKNTVDEGNCYYGGIIIRKNTPEVNKLFEEWWAEYSVFPTRDQISLYKVFKDKCEVLKEDFKEYVEWTPHN